MAQGSVAAGSVAMGGVAVFAFAVAIAPAIPSVAAVALAVAFAPLAGPVAIDIAPRVIRPFAPMLASAGLAATVPSVGLAARGGRPCICR